MTEKILNSGVLICTGVPGNKKDIYHSVCKFTFKSCFLQKSLLHGIKLLIANGSNNFFSLTLEDRYIIQKEKQ